MERKPAPAARNRREFLFHLGAGLGSVALTALLADDAARAGLLTARHPHHPARARACIFLCMEGGPSHIDTFDPKPVLRRLPLDDRRSRPTIVAWRAQAREPASNCEDPMTPFAHHIEVELFDIVRICPETPMEHAAAFAVTAALLGLVVYGTYAAIRDFRGWLRRGKERPTVA